MEVMEQELGELRHHAASAAVNNHTSPGSPELSDPDSPVNTHVP
jgi:hypothetical protein